MYKRGRERASGLLEVQLGVDRAESVLPRLDFGELGLERLDLLLE